MTEHYSMPADAAEVSGVRGYFRATKTATWGFLMALPLLILYEVGVIWTNAGREGIVRVSVDSTLLRTLLSNFGLTSELILLGIVLVTGVVILVWERKKNVEYSFRYPGLILLESSIYAVILGMIVSGLTQMLVSPLMMVQQEGSLGLPLEIVLSFGAGLYEELVFRVLLVGGLFLVLRLIFPQKRILMYVIAAVIGALCFSAIHHVGSMADPWEIQIFLFRTIFGLAFNVVFLIRGFAIVAWTHAIYDVMIFTGFFNLF